jgi:prepilin signal peptidase PulO-like enzyme (type II secretory pathway)
MRLGDRRLGGHPTASAIEGDAMKAAKRLFLPTTYALVLIAAFAMALDLQGIRVRDAVIGAAAFVVFVVCIFLMATSGGGDE